MTAKRTAVGRTLRSSSVVPSKRDARPLSPRVGGVGKARRRNLKPTAGEIRASANENDDDDDDDDDAMDIDVRVQRNNVEIRAVRGKSTPQDYLQRIKEAQQEQRALLQKLMEQKNDNNTNVLNDDDDDEKERTTARYLFLVCGTCEPVPYNASLVPTATQSVGDEFDFSLLCEEMEKVVEIEIEEVEKKKKKKNSKSKRKTTKVKPSSKRTRAVIKCARCNKFLDPTQQHGRKFLKYNNKGCTCHVKYWKECIGEAGQKIIEEKYPEYTCNCGNVLKAGNSNNRRKDGKGGWRCLRGRCQGEEGKKEAIEMYPEYTCNCGNVLKAGNSHRRKDGKGGWRCEKGKCQGEAIEMYPEYTCNCGNVLKAGDSNNRRKDGKGGWRCRKGRCSKK